MREIDVNEITAAVSHLCQESNFNLPDDVVSALQKALQQEESPEGKDVLNKLLENANIASKECLPICQDCGVALVYIEMGQEVRLTGGDLYQAIHQGVREGYNAGYLRKSIVNHPFSDRINTGDNTPAIVHTEIVPGDKITLKFMPKGAGSENMSRLFMLSPSSGKQGIVEAVVTAVEEAGSNPCPPVVVGVGVGGTAEKAIDISKRVMFRKVGEPGTDPEAAELENEILRRLNKLGIGPQGFGGRVTALAVHVGTFPCHIGSLPVAVNIQCHALRRKEAVL